jgi:hypothetical protein
MMQHTIKKQVIDLSLDKKLDAFIIQQKVSDEYYSKILPMLLQVFDAVSNDVEVIEIDSLSVDIGTIDLKDLDKADWTDIVVKKITEQLIDVNLGLSSNIKSLKKTKPLSSADQWIYYMRHGYLPWNVLSLTEDWYLNVLSAFAADSNAISKLRDLIKNDSGSVTRIVSQNSESFLSSLIETLTAENQRRLSPLINKLAQINSSSGKNKIKLWVQTLLFVASEKADLNPEKIADHLESNSSNKGIPDKKENAMIYKNEVPEEGIYVANAGVVLLHPFLNQFFKNLLLIKEDGFIDSLSHQKALFLLHYLATGNTNPNEHELVMAKILCGYPLGKPINNMIELTPDELGESKSLLISAIGQWSILKGTSADGLREGFLQRNGKLYSKNETLILQVEQGAIDMLLDNLPWNLSIIKLPWMKDILKVEWR